MIRGVFWLLLLLNAAVLAWVMWGGALTQDKSALQPALNPGQIKLLNDVPGVSAVPAIPASAPVMPSPPAQHGPASAVGSSSTAPQHNNKKSTVCMEWGEFSGSDLAHASQDLEGLKLGKALTRREVEHSTGYWVFIPPPKHRADVDKKVAQLKRLGVKEFFVVQEKGKWYDAISLNVFKTEEMAKKYQKQLESKGVKNTKVGERQTRLKFTVFVLKNPSSALQDKLRQWQKQFSGIDLKPATCM